MNSTTTISEPRRRVAWAGLWLIGAVALGGLTALDQPLIGAGLYAILALTAITLWARYPGTLFDERDAGIHRQASGYTIGVLAISSAVVFPLLTALYGLGLFNWGAWTTASAFIAAGVFAIYAVTTLVLSHRY
jgi:uncharacterized membrane protein